MIRAKMQYSGSVVASACVGLYITSAFCNVLFTTGWACRRNCLYLTDVNCTSWSVTGDGGGGRVASVRTLFVTCAKWILLNGGGDRKGCLYATVVVNTVRLISGQGRIGFDCHVAVLWTVCFQDGVGRNSGWFSSPLVCSEFVVSGGAGSRAK